MVRVVFLGKLRDLAGNEVCELPAPIDWPRLITALPPAIVAELREGRVTVACAGRVLADPSQLVAEAGDEVALLPPVSGG